MKFIPVCAMLAVLSVAAADGAPASGRPNFLFILADDLGWGDLGCYGGSLKTPHLDRLAQQGTLFTQFYVNASVCSPSRAAFFTSQYPAAHRIHGHFATPKQNTERGMAQFLAPDVPNIARILQAEGYATAHVGKWHLGEASGGPPTSDYGFEFVGSSEDPAGPYVDDPHYRAKSTALFVDETLDFIKRRGGRPFYVQLWTLVPHAYVNPTPEQLEPYTRSLNRHRPHLAPAAIYHATILDLDRQIGRLVAGLQQLGVLGDTVLLFSSDNGPESIQISSARHSGVGSAGPLRGRKRSLYEGGVRVPFLAHWPDRIPAGRIDDTSVVAAVDLLPTLCRLAGAAGARAAAWEGEDVGDILLGTSRTRTKPLVWEWRFRIAGHVWDQSPRLAIREGDWKLLMNPDGSRVELYDIPRDPSEFDNLAAMHPARVARLSERLLGWQRGLPAGPVDASAGRNDYPWPGRR